MFEGKGRLLRVFHGKVVQALRYLRVRVFEDFGRGDFMTLDFIGHRPLPVRDLEVLIKDGSCEINCPKLVQRENLTV